MRQLALFSIEIYKRYLSPYKGFYCAYRIHTGCQSCSTLGYRAIRRYGVAGGIRLLQQRLRKCGVAYKRHHMAEGVNRRGALRSQRGDCDPGCDVPCDGCDLPDLDCPSCNLPKGACNASCWDCGACDCGDWRRDKRKKERRKKDEQQTYIPPQRWPDQATRRHRAQS